MRWIALTLLLAGVTGAATEIYQWEDADGVVHFSDRPPTNLPAEQRPVGEPSVVEAWRAGIKPRAKPARATGRSRAMAVEARRAREEKRAEQCHRARQRLAEVRAKRRAGYKASEGRALKRRAARYQQDVRFYCGSFS